MPLLRRPASIARTALLVCAVAMIGGCDVLGNADLIRSLRKDPGPQEASPVTEQGLGKLAKGELMAAHGLFDQALKVNPADVYALMGKGLIFQRWNEPTQARAAYQAVLALRPDESVKMTVPGGYEPQSVAELASVSLAMLSGSESLTPNDMAQRPQVAGTVQPMQGGPGVPMAGPTLRPGGPVRPGASQPYLNEADMNVMARFEVLGKLRDQGLITPDEYAERRKANIGVLLPMTSPAPASTGLDRPVPATEQIVGRLGAINRALEMRAINVRQHSVERTTIIDGLLPATPRATQNPPLPPRGLLEAADGVRRLEAIKEKGLINNDEYTKEKEVIERTLTPPPAPRAASTGGPSGAAVPQVPVTAGAPLAGGGGPKPAVHIASYRSEDAATKGWAQLRRAHQPLLGNLQPEVSRVNLGAGKGVFFRLMAGPLPSQAEADRICRELKAKRQFCETAFMSAGGPGTTGGTTGGMSLLPTDGGS